MGLSRVFSLYRHMTVDNVGFLRIQSELCKYPVDHLFIFQECVVRILLLNMSLLLGKKIPFKCGHFVFAEQRGIRMKPDIPHDVFPRLPFSLIQRKKTFPHITVEHIIQLSSSVFFPEKRDLFQISFLIKRDASVVEKIVIIYLVQPALGEQESHMLLESVASSERPFKTFHDL